MTGNVPLSNTRPRLLIFSSLFKKDFIELLTEKCSPDNIFVLLVHWLEMNFNEPSEPIWTKAIFFAWFWNTLYFQWGQFNTPWCFVDKCYTCRLNAFHLYLLSTTVYFNSQVLFFSLGSSDFLHCSPWGALKLRKILIFIVHCNIFTSTFSPHCISYTSFPTFSFAELHHTFLTNISWQFFPSSLARFLN